MQQIGMAAFQNKQVNIIVYLDKYHVTGHLTWDKNKVYRLPWVTSIYSSRLHRLKFLI